MVCDPLTDEVWDVANEAAGRLNVALKMLEDVRNPNSDSPDMDGYDFVLVREIIKDVVATLRVMADAGPEQPKKGGGA